MSNPAVSSERAVVEGCIRNERGLSAAGRKRWWGLLTRFGLQESLSSIDPQSLSHFLSTCLSRFKAAVATYEIEGIQGEILYKSMSSSSLYLDRPGVGKTSDLVKLVGHSLKIPPQDCIFIVPFAYRICSVLDRSDIAFCTICDVMGNPSYYTPPTYYEFRILIATFRDMVHKQMPQTYSSLMEIGGLQDIYLLQIFTGYFFNLLSEDKALVIVDNFLLDGGISLFRFGLAILHMHKREIKSLNFSSGENLWSHIKKKMCSEQSHFSILCEIAFEKKRSALNSLIGDKKGLHMPTRQQILARFVELQNSLNKKDVHRQSSFFDTLRSVVAKASWMSGPSTSIPLTYSKILSHSMLLHLGDMLFDNVFGSFYPIKTDADSCTATSSLISSPSALPTTSSNSKSNSNDNLLAGMKVGNEFLAPLVGIECFRLAFASYRDGSSLEALYENCKSSSPSIILIKSLRSEAVFGAFVSASLGPPFGEAKGDVDSFVFRLDDQGNNGSVTPSFFSTVDVEKGMQELEPYRQVALRYARQQYVRCAKSQISFGLSVGRSPSHVIRINEDVSMCWSGASETFGNRVSLVPEEDSPFPIVAVEVWCGRFKPVEPITNTNVVDISQMAGGGTMTLYDDEDEYYESPTFANLGSLNPYNETVTGLQHLKLMNTGDIDGGVLDGGDEEAIDVVQLRAQKMAEKEVAYWENLEYKSMEKRRNKKKKNSPWVNPNNIGDASETSSKRSDHGINVAQLAHSSTPVKRSGGGHLLARRSSAILSNASFDDDRLGELPPPRAPIDKYQAAVLAAKASLGIVVTGGGDTNEGVDVVPDTNNATTLLWESASIGNDANMFYSDNSSDDDLDVDDFLQAFSDDHDHDIGPLGDGLQQQEYKEEEQRQSLEQYSIQFQHSTKLEKNVNLKVQLENVNLENGKRRQQRDELINLTPAPNIVHIQDDDIQPPLFNKSEIMSRPFSVQDDVGTNMPIWSSPFHDAGISGVVEEYNNTILPPSGKTTVCPTAPPQYPSTSNLSIPVPLPNPRRPSVNRNTLTSSISIIESSKNDEFEL